MSYPEYFSPVGKISLKCNYWCYWTLFIVLKTKTESSFLKVF
jgi:hypothetical protein